MIRCICENEPPCKKARGANRGNTDPAIQLLLSHTDLWVHGILPFLGPGHYVFVAGVSQRFKELYRLYFATTIMDLPMVKHPKQRRRIQATCCDTFYGVTFSSLSCAQRWHGVASNGGCEPQALKGTKVCALAAKAGSVPVLQWARDNGFEWDATTCANAAKSGNLPVLQLAFSNGCPWDKRTCEEAAVCGHLEVLQWAHKHGCPKDEYMCERAAENGHLHILKWAHKVGCKWNEWTCAQAAKGGHLDVLQWVHQKGCPWDEWTCTFAAANGHFQVLQYAHSNGCPWNADTHKFAAKYPEIADWIQREGCQ